MSMSEVTIVALHDHYDDACGVVVALIEAGAPRETISLLANNVTGDHPPLIANPTFAREDVAAKEEQQPAAATGTEFGIGVGGILGVLVGAGAIAIPGIGPLVAAG